MKALSGMRWVALAIAGLAVAAGVSLAASQLVSERIGLAAEPVSAGRELAPARGEHHGGPHHAAGGDHTVTTPTQTTTPTAPTTTVVPPTTMTTPSPSSPTPPATSPPTTSPHPGSSGGEHEGADD